MIDYEGMILDQQERDAHGELLEFSGREYTLIDDGTMDTVIAVHCACGCTWEERFSCDAAAEYRDGETGEMIRLNDLINDYLDDEPCLDCGE